MTEEEFRILFDRLFDPIRSYLYYRSGDTELSTDLAQETFLKVWEKQKKLDPDKDRGLLYKIAGDLFISHFRRRKTGDAALREAGFELVTDGPEESMMYREIHAIYESTLGAMPEHQRTVFLMNRMEGLTYREIAERLSLSLKAVEKRMSGALRTLKNAISNTQ